MSDKPARLAELDLFKTMLVLGMVTIHVLQLLSRSMPLWTERVSEFINLVTFSGFLLAMGIGLGLARNRERPWLQRLRPMLLLLLASYVSSFAFALLVDRQAVSAELVLDVLTLRRLFGWSEFLASFFMLYLVVALARPALVAVASNPAGLIVASALCLGSTMLVLDQGWPLTATLVGTTRFASFPLLPYLPWFLVGIALGKAGGRLGVWHGVFALAGTGWLVWTMMQSGGLPGRFPPTVAWVVGPALVLLGYLLVARAIAVRIGVPDWVTVPGRHVLSFLLISNLGIFLLRNLQGKPVHNVANWLGLSVLIIGVIGAGWLLRERRGKGGEALA